MIPITISQLINNLFNMVDNIMVGSLDINGLAISAVNIANKPYLIFFGLFFGMTGGAGLMISQYYGANDHKTCQGLFTLQLFIGTSIAMIFFFMLRFFPEPIMNIFATDESTISLGVEYMQIAAFSYLPVAISSTCIFSLRSLGINRISMIVSIFTMGINAIFNYLLIFGNFGFPEMGIAGAALGTLIARICEMLFYLYVLASKKTLFVLDLSAAFKLPRKITIDFLKRALPLIFNELLWTIGNSVYFWCYAKINEYALPAITIADLCYQISAVLATGVSSAVSVMIGKELGANRLEEAKQNAKRLFLLALAIGFVCLFICLVLAHILPLFFTVSGSLLVLSTELSIISALFAPISIIYGFCFFCLRAGGDTRNAMMLDSGYMWLVPVPISITIATLFPSYFSIYWIFVTVQILMNAKVFWAIWVLKKGTWIRNITGIKT